MHRRSVALLWIGQTVSNMGDALFLVGVVYLALEVTGSKALTGGLLAMSYAPSLLLGLFAGAFVDRHDRRKVMICADLVRFAAVGAIPPLFLSGHLGAGALGAAMFALAAGTTLFNPAMKAIIPDMLLARARQATGRSSAAGEDAPEARPVYTSGLTTATAVFHLSEYLSFVAGPLIGAAVMSAVGFIHLFTVDSLTFLFSAACLALIPRAALPPARTPPAARTGVAPAQVLHEVREALRAVAAMPLVATLLILTAVDNLLIMGPAYVGTPLLVKETLGLGPEAYGRAMTFFFLGMAVGTAVVWALARHARNGLLIIIGITLDGLTFLPFAFCTTLAQVQAALFAHALVVPLILVPRTVLLQQAVPGALHGRVFALLNLTVFGMTALSSALTGVLCEVISPRALFAATAVLGILPGLAGLLIPSLRRAA